MTTYEVKCTTFHYGLEFHQLLPDIVKNPGEKGVKTLYHVGNSA